MVHIHRQVGPGIGNPSADFLGNGNAGHGERLVGALGLHLKGPGAVQIITQIFLDGAVDGIEILFAGTAPAQADHAENRAAGLPGAVHISAFIHRLHINRGLHDIDIKIAVGLYSVAHILTQAVFKLTLVCALQHNLAQLQQKNFLHLLITSFIWCMRFRFQARHRFPRLTARYWIASAMC